MLINSNENRCMAAILFFDETEEKKMETRSADVMNGAFSAPGK